MTGTVKLWNRQKAFGFIVPDDPSLADVFVHRTSIKCGLSLDESGPHYPYLRKGERVAFETEPSRDIQRAVGLTFLDGRPVPLLRRDYLVVTREGVIRELGEHVLSIYGESSATGDNTTPEEREQILADAYQQARQRIQRAIDRIEQFGMDPETDFYQERDPRRER